MGISYDVFIGEFLSKVTERDLLSFDRDERDDIVIGYMKRSISGFKKNCKYDLIGTMDDEIRMFHVEIPENDLNEIADIVSEE